MTNAKMKISPANNAPSPIGPIKSVTVVGDSKMRAKSAFAMSHPVNPAAAPATASPRTEEGHLKRERSFIASRSYEG